MTAESLMAEADEVRRLALAAGQLGPAIAAIKEKGILSGKRVERSEHGQPGEFEVMDDETLRLELQARIAALGSAIPLMLVTGPSKAEH